MKFRDVWRSGDTFPDVSFVFLGSPPKTNKHGSVKNGGLVWKIRGDFQVCLSLPASAIRRLPESQKKTSEVPINDNCSGLWVHAWTRPNVLCHFVPVLYGEYF